MWVVLTNPALPEGGVQLFMYFATVPNKCKSGSAVNPVGIGFGFLWFRAPVSAVLSVAGQWAAVELL